MIQYTKEYIAKLLDKYMDGTSTLDEETILSQYFRGKNIPEEWLCYKQMFQEIEAMAPQPKTHNRWAIWSIAAAAVVAGVLYLAVSPRQTGFVPTEPLTAQADTTSQQTIAPADTVTAQPAQTAEPQQPAKVKKRSLRKSEPTIHDSRHRQGIHPDGRGHTETEGCGATDSTGRAGNHRGSVGSLRIYPRHARRWYHYLYKRTNRIYCI